MPSKLLCQGRPSYAGREETGAGIGDDLEKQRELKQILKTRPYYVVIALDKRIFDSMEVLKESPFGRQAEYAAFYQRPFRPFDRR